MCVCGWGGGVVFTLGAESVVCVVLDSGRKDCAYFE